MSTLLKVFLSRDKALVILCLELALLALTHSLLHFDKVTAVELNLDPDVGKSTVELVQARGYVVETHNVTTIDGYILSMHRLPMSYEESQADTTDNDKADRNKPAVFVQHGMVASSFAWVCDSRNHSLAYVLADAGYDVWLGNNRGNTYSSSHVRYTTKDDAFWDFSWEEMGKFDMPAMLNYALETSGRETLALVGYSQGSTQAFVAFAENQTLARSVSYYAALGPVAWLGNTASRTFKLLARAYFDKVLEASNQVQLFSHNALLRKIIQPAACHMDPELCASGFALVVKSTENLNASRIGAYTSDVPSGTSVKSMRHYAQSIRENTFSAFDYGCRCPRMLGIHLCPKNRCINKVKYGSFDPPDFSISSMEYPRTGLFTGENDIFATRADIDQLRSALPSSTIVYEKEISSFGHLDFVWAVQANEKLYQPLLKQLEQYVDTGY